MATAYLLLKPEPCYRSEAFATGLRAIGMKVIHGAPRTLKPDDAVVCWNRGDAYRPMCKAAGATLLVAENGYLNREWRGSYWYALSRDYHNGAGSWNPGGPERWESWGIPINPWRTGGEYVLILESRGIGDSGIAAPRGWSQRMFAKLSHGPDPVLYRTHPGTDKTTEHPSLYDNLAAAKKVVTWGSAAALKALLYGVPVENYFSQWIGTCGTDRQFTFERLAWAMWSIEELSSGEPFSRLLQHK